MDDYIKRREISLTLNVLARLIKATPVDTGWARANWIPSARRPSRRLSPGITRRDQRQAALGTVQAAQQRGTASLLNELGKPGVVPFFCTNNVPYIGALNNGHSKQAPAGFIQREIVAAVVNERSRAAVVTPAR